MFDVVSNRMLHGVPCALQGVFPSPASRRFSSEHKNSVSPEHWTIYSGQYTITHCIGCNRLNWKSKWIAASLPPWIALPTFVSPYDKHALSSLHLALHAAWNTLSLCPFVGLRRFFRMSSVYFPPLMDAVWFAGFYACVFSLNQWSFIITFRVEYLVLHTTW